MCQIRCSQLCYIGHWEKVAFSFTSGTSAPRCEAPHLSTLGLSLSFSRCSNSWKVFLDTVKVYRLRCWVTVWWRLACRSEETVSALTWDLRSMEPMSFLTVVKETLCLEFVIIYRPGTRSAWVWHNVSAAPKMFGSEVTSRWCVWGHLEWCRADTQTQNNTTCRGTKRPRGEKQKGNKEKLERT